jgi:hypothetical protein
MLHIVYRQNTFNMQGAFAIMLDTDNEQKYI